MTYNIWHQCIVWYHTDVVSKALKSDQANACKELLVPVVNTKLHINKCIYDHKIKHLHSSHSLLVYEISTMVEDDDLRY